MITGITTSSQCLRIVGIDPGTTAAVAVLDLDGNLVDYKSSKNFSKDQIIQFIISHGKPLIIGTDVASLPSSIEDIASSMGAIRSVPSEDLQASYKSRLTEKFDVDRTDAHTADALAAAEYAYREYHDKIDAVRSRATQADLENSQVNEVIETVMKQGVTTDAAITRTQARYTAETPTEDSDTDRTSTRDERNWQRIAEKRQEKIDRLEDKITHLEEYVQTLDNDSSQELSVSEDELRKRNREINTLRSKLDHQKTRNEQLQEQNNRLETALHHILEQDWMFVPAVDSLAETEEDIVYCDAYSGDDISPTLDTVITTASLLEAPAYQSLRDRGIQVVSLSSLHNPVTLSNGYVVDPEEVLRTGESEKFMEWLESYKKRQTL